MPTYIDDRAIRSGGWEAMPEAWRSEPTRPKAVARPTVGTRLSPRRGGTPKPLVACSALTVFWAVLPTYWSQLIFVLAEHERNFHIALCFRQRQITRAPLYLQKQPIVPEATFH